MRKLLAAALLSFTLALVFGLAPAPAGASESGDFIGRINGIRSSQGLGSLGVDGELSSVAQAWAEHMAASGGISHNPNLAGQVSANWWVIGENVGVGYDVGGLMDAFVNSSSHYANIVDSGYTHIGVGVAWGGDGRLYTAHAFMGIESAPAPAPAPAPPPAPAPAPAPARSAAPAAPAATPAPAMAVPAPVAAAVPAPPAAPERVATVLAALRAVA